ncbi:lipopolysaccharide heptosyltransferase II [Candidatus Woesearchaeota archaeon CG11_big_fil_rev_8_21_14_0_20_43_8]|nr:MAG: lipopolysaccharide heptosyltransferase II [Candidatus Woesearchaeota archaeon CG11_big_fil_rev_8_21_14_0_20_43_8]
MLMTTPFLRELKKKYPDSTIHYMVGKWSKAVLVNNPNVDKIIPLEDKEWIRPTNNLFNKFKKILSLRKCTYDSIYFLDGDIWIQGLLFLIKSKKRVGFYKGRKSLFLTKKIKSNKDTMYLANYFSSLVKNTKSVENKITKMELYLTDEERKKAANFLKSNKINSKHKVIGICVGGASNPGTTGPLKKWGLDKYESLIERLLKGLNTKVIIFGGKKDMGLIKIKHENLLDLSGKIPLRDSCAIIGKCNLFITHDTGPMHIAGALNVPMVAIFGPTSPIIFAPQNKNSIILHKKKLKCVPCLEWGNFADCKDHKCMRLIRVADVLLAIKKLHRIGLS